MIVFIIPTYNYKNYLHLIGRNNWLKSYYPYFPLRTSSGVYEKKNPLIKRTLEFFFSGRLGEKLDAFFLRVTLNHRKKKFHHCFLWLAVAIRKLPKKSSALFFIFINPIPGLILFKSKPIPLSVIFSRIPLSFALSSI